MKFKLINPAGIDNHGHKLSQEQVDFFKNTVVRDKQGKLLACFHGTHYFGFSDFDPAGMDKGFSWFTPDYSYAHAYTYEDDYYEEESGVYRCYLNITNPLEVGNVECEIVKENSETMWLSDNELEETDFSDEFRTLANKVHMTAKDLYNSNKWHEDNLIFDITRSDTFADIILKLGYDGLVSQENKGRSKCFAVPYTMPYNIKKCNNYKPTKSRYIDEEAEN